MHVRILALAAVATLALVAILPAAAHESSEHGTLDLRSSWTDVVEGETPHFACDVYIGGNDVDQVSGMFGAIEAPVDWFEFLSYFNTTKDHNETEDGLLVEGTTDETPPVDFVAGPFDYLPPGYYDIGVDLGDDWFFGNHSMPSVDFVIDGPCGPRVIPCPTDLTASLQADNSVILEWVDDPDSNGTILLRAVTWEGDLRFVNRTAAHANTFHDTNTYAGATFYYQVVSMDPWGKECPKVSVTVPGERTFFPCAEDIQVYATVEGVQVVWGRADGTNLSKVYRAEEGGPMEHVYTSDGFIDFRDHNVTEGIPYTYMVNGLFAEGESSGCPTASLEEGWFLPAPDTEWPPGEGGEPTECEVVVTLERRTDGILVSWNGAHGIRTTDIYRDVIGDSRQDNTTLYARVVGNATSYLDTNVSADDAYWYGIVVNEGENPRYCGSSVAASIPNFPSLLATGLALALGVLGYAWVRRRQDK